jgi:hypothetical protein
MARSYILDLATLKSKAKIHALSKKPFTWPEMEDRKRSGVRAHVLLIIQCTIQISGLVWQTQNVQNGCSFLLV